MGKNNLTDEQYNEIETAVYSIFDTIPVIKDYCAYNRENNSKIAYLEPILQNVFNDFDKIASKF